MEVGISPRLEMFCLPVEWIVGSVGGLGTMEDRFLLLMTGSDRVSSGAKDGRLISFTTFSMPCSHQVSSKIPSHVMRVFSSGSSISRIRERQSTEIWKRCWEKKNENELMWNRREVTLRRKIMPEIRVGEDHTATSCKNTTSLRPSGWKLNRRVQFSAERPWRCIFVTVVPRLSN